MSKRFCDCIDRLTVVQGQLWFPAACAPLVSGGGTASTESPKTDPRASEGSSWETTRGPACHEEPRFIGRRYSIVTRALHTTMVGTRSGDEVGALAGPRAPTSSPLLVPTIVVC